MTIYLITAVSLIVEATWKLLGPIPKDYTRIDIIPCTYWQLSIKNMEMQKQENLTTNDHSFIFIKSI